MSKQNKYSFSIWRFFPFVTLSNEYLREFSKKFETALMLRGLGETDSWKKPEVENLVALSL